MSRYLSLFFFIIASLTIHAESSNTELKAQFAQAYKAYQEATESADKQA